MADVNPNSPEDIRRAAHEILGRPEFQRERQHWWQKVLYYFSHPIDALNTFLSWIFDRFTGNGASPIVAWIIAAIAIGIAVFILMRLTKSVSTDSAIKMRQIPIDKSQSYKDLLDKAALFESQQRWRDAIRVRYSALILQLADAGVIRQRQGKTTGEYQNELHQNVPFVAMSFSNATRIFESVWYGNVQPTADDLTEFVSHSRSVLVGVEK